MNWNFYWATAEAIDSFFGAIRRGDVDDVRKITSEFPKICRWERGDGMRPLDAFAESQNASVELLDFLISLEPDAFGQQANPVYVACHAGNLKSLRLLIERGFDPNGSSSALATPLHMAAGKGRLQAAEYLLANGADAGREDNRRKTPLEVAQEKKRAELIELLEQHPDVERTPFVNPEKARETVELDLRAEESAIRQMIHEAVAACQKHRPKEITAVALHGSGYRGFVECGFETDDFDPEAPDCGADVALSQMGRLDFPTWKEAYAINNRVVVEYGTAKPWSKTAHVASCEALDTPYFRFLKKLLKSMIQEDTFDALPLAEDCWFGVQTFFHHHCEFWKRKLARSAKR